MQYTQNLANILNSQAIVNAQEYKQANDFGKMNISEYNALQSQLNSYEKDVIAVNALAAKNEALFSHLFSQGFGHASPPFDPSLSHLIDVEYDASHFDGEGLSIFIRAGGKVMSPLPKTKYASNYEERTIITAHRSSPLELWELSKSPLSSAKEVLHIYYHECFKSGYCANYSHLETFYRLFMPALLSSHYRISPEMLKAMKDVHELPSGAVVLFLNSVFASQSSLGKTQLNEIQKELNSKNLSCSSLSILESASRENHFKYNQQLFEILWDDYKDSCYDDDFPCKKFDVCNLYPDGRPLEPANERLLYQVLASNFLNEKLDLVNNPENHRHWQSVLEFTQSKDFDALYSNGVLEACILNHLLAHPSLLNEKNEDEVNAFIQQNIRISDASIEMLLQKELVLKEDAPSQIVRNTHLMKTLIQWADRKFDQKSLKLEMAKFHEYYQLFQLTSDLTQIKRDIQEEFKSQCLTLEEEEEQQSSPKFSRTSISTALFPGFTAYNAYQSLADYQKIFDFSQNIEPRYLVSLMDSIPLKNPLTRSLFEKKLKLSVSPVKLTSTPSPPSIVRF